MAGYIFNLDSFESLKWCVENGIYSTKLTRPSNQLWKIHHEGTLADYLSMKAGDNVYFFISRKIYGIGEISQVGHDCKYLNYPDADKPLNYEFLSTQPNMLINESELNLNNRFAVTFTHAPNFFKNGIDMDDVLSYNPSSFRMLRAFWKVSFIKIDDEENKALKDIILKRNELYIMDNDNTFNFSYSMHNSILEKINTEYYLSANNFLSYASNAENTKIRHEMAIEAGIIDVICSNSPQNVFGEWSYISHQVVASPFKPIDYMDKIDVFGYKNIRNYSTISKYLLIEIKKDEASIESIDQIMKYVDWINQEYTFGDYSMIEAYLVCYDFSEEVINYKNRICIRNFTKGRRPTISDTWTSIKLLKYSYQNESLNFTEV